MIVYIYKGSYPVKISKMKSLSLRNELQAKDYRLCIHHNQIKQYQNAHNFNRNFIIVIQSPVHVEVTKTDY